MTARICLALASLTLATSAVCAWGQDAPRPTRITLYPATAPTPVLKYRFTFPFRDRIPGNAAVYYGKVKFEQNAFFRRSNEHTENSIRWAAMPLEELRRENPDVPFPAHYIEEAARCESCDWQLPIRREWFDGILLPEVQEMRSFGRHLAARIRVDVARGDYETAVNNMRLCYTMARHAAEGETMVNGLVGAAICGITSYQALELVQQPGAPNLYWAWAELPEPIIDFRDAIDVESDYIELNIPQMRHLQQQGGAPEGWSSVLFDLWDKMTRLSDEPAWRRTPEYLVARSLRSYPLAKRHLAELGRSAEEVQRMPIAQVILLDAMAVRRALHEEAAAAFRLPYPIAKERLADVDQRAAAMAQEGRGTLPPSGFGLNVLATCRTAQARVQREFAVLQLLEALRIHAAANGGRLPEKLAEITEVPVPEDPVTDAPFDYELSGGIARLRSPEISNVEIDYAILMSELPK